MELPSQTIYINNLNEKLKKPTLKKLLYMLFSQYGKVIQIVACKGIKLRGQAWIVYDNEASAIAAMKGKQGFKFYDKPMKIAFSKTKSDVVAKKEGLAVPVRAVGTKRPLEKTAPGSTRAGDDEDEMMGSGEPRSKQQNRGMAGGSVPNKILFATQLPVEATEQMLRVLFQQCPGLTDLRMVPGKGMAFVEFQNEVQSAMAMSSLNGFQLNETATLSLSFAM